MQKWRVDSYMSLNVYKTEVSDSITHKVFDINVTKLDVHYEVGLNNAFVQSGRTVSVNLKNCVTKDSLYDKFNSQTLLDINCKFKGGRFVLKRCVILSYKTELINSVLMEDIDMMALDIEVTDLKKCKLYKPIIPFIFR